MTSAYKLLYKKLYVIIFKLINLLQSLFRKRSNVEDQIWFEVFLKKKKSWGRRGREQLSMGSFFLRKLTIRSFLRKLTIKFGHYFFTPKERVSKFEHVEENFVTNAMP